MTILAAERTAVLTGRYDVLPTFVAGKEAALAALGQTKITRLELIKVKESIDANQRLVQAALRGIASARARITSLEQIRDTLSFYGPTGSKSEVNTSPSTVEHKA